MLELSLIDIVNKLYGIQHIKEFGNRSCEIISREIAEQLLSEWHQPFEVTVSEDDFYFGGEW